MSFIQRLNHMSGTWKRWAFVAGLGVAMAHPQTASAVEKSKKIQIRRAKKSKRTAPKTGELRKLSVAQKPSGELFVELSLSSPGNFNAYRTHDPERLVIDLVGTKPGKLGRRKELSTWVSSGILVYPVQVAGFEATRVEVELRRKVSYEVDGSKRSIRLSLVPNTPAPANQELPAKSGQAREMQAKLARTKKEVLAMQSRQRQVQAQVALADETLKERQAQVQAAQKAVDHYLAEAKKAKQESLTLRAEAKAELAKIKAAKAEAKKQAKTQASREELRQNNLALRADKGRLRNLLAQETKARRKLELDMSQRSKRISRLELQIKRAKARMSETDVPALRRALAQSRAEQRALELSTAALRQDLERMKKTQARQTSSKKEAKVYQAMLRERQAILEQTQERLAKSKREQRRVKAALAKGQGKTYSLAKAHAKAKQKLAMATTRLEQMHNKTGEQTKALRNVQGELRAAQTKLARTLEKLAMQTQAHEKALARATQSAKTLPKAEPKRLISGLKLVDEGDSMRIVLSCDGPVKATKRQVSPTMQLLEVKNAKLISALERSFDARAYKGPIAKITSFNDDTKVSIMVTAQAQARSKIVRDKGVISWVFPKEGQALAQGPNPRVQTMHQAPVAAASSKAGSSRRSGPSRRQKWHGERIDIELQDAPIKDVLLLFSDIGRVNIIAGKDVSGRVSLKLNSVPWDQALDIILRSLGLGLIKEGNVIRVATTADLEAERARAIERASAQVQLKPLETRLVPLSYATVDEMVPKVQSVLSSRGSVTPDTRTNVLIIMDVAENISLAEQLVSQLDGQTPQVLIEARIVEARTQWLRQLGIQWGFDAIASPGTGNPTGLLFPSSVGVAGGSGGTQADRRGIILSGSQQNPNYAVDLPAPVGTGNGGAIGMSFGSLAGNLNTNLRLSAAEEGGEVRLISAPKVVTMDNTKASIEQGVQIPISQVSQNGVNTRYVNATLGLQVTPHVTNEGSIVLEVQVQKNEADFVNTGARGDPTILTKQAKSRMLIQDGDTAVIGGIYTRNQSTNRKKVPWIAEVPILGWFFKNRSEADTRTELLIFLTPKIINRSTSIGG